MKLSRMQDFGGCRVITDNVEQAYRVFEEYSRSRVRHELVRENDYISKPKKSGYRCLHRVFRYHSDKKNAYDGMLIEVQVRTHLQHVWATAVEVMGNSIGMSLKSSQGDETILRFFALASSIFAMLEKTALVPDTPENKNEIIDELIRIDSEHRILDKLDAISNTIGARNEIASEYQNGYAVLILRPDGYSEVVPFKPRMLNEAIDYYDTLEAAPENLKVDAVLVRVSSLSLIAKVYPNYFGDTREFVDIIKRVFLKRQDKL